MALYSCRSDRQAGLLTEITCVSTTTYQLLGVSISPYTYAPSPIPTKVPTGLPTPTPTLTPTEVRVIKYRA